MEASSCLKAVVLAGNQYMNNKTDTNLTYFQRQLDILIGISARGQCSKLFNLRELSPTQCITLLTDILGDPETKTSLLQKCIMLLSNLAQDSHILECLHESFHVTPALASVIKRHGLTTDSLTQECLSFLQRVTYGHRISFQEKYVEDLVTYLVRHIEGPKTDLTQSCLGLLVNLCRDNFATQSYIKNMNNKKFWRTVMTYLSDQNFTITVFSLSLCCSVCLEEEIGEKLFNENNINQTFQMIFNILVNGDAGQTRRYAVDLFKDLLRVQKIQQKLTSYSYLSPCIEQLLNMISTSTPESVVKIFELLLAFCGLEGVRATACKSLLSNTHLEDIHHCQKLLQLPISQLKEPLIATLHWASQSTESHETAPLYALEFLTEFYEELVYTTSMAKCAAHANLILPVLVSTLKTAIDGDVDIRHRKCSKIVRGLKLLIVLCEEDAMRQKVANNVNKDLLSQLLEYQFNNNKVALGARKIQTAAAEDWSESGVDVVLFTLDLLSKLRRSVPELNALFTNTMQDGRIISFLATGMTSEKREQVQVSLQLVGLGAALEGFPAIILADAVAAANVHKKEDWLSRDVPSLTPQKRFREHRLMDKENVPAVKKQILSDRSSFDQDASIQSLIEKMHSGLDLKDMKASEIIDIYEHKLQSAEIKENHLQDLLDAKAMALAQADRMIAQYRSRRGQTDAEAQKLRSLLVESERRSEEYSEKLNDIKLERESLQNNLEIVVQENEKLQQIAEEHQKVSKAYSELTERLNATERNLTSLRQDHQTLTEMHEMLKKHNETLKHQHDIATEQLQKLQDERNSLSKELKEKETKLTDVSKTLHKVQGEYKKTEKERDQLEEAIDNLRTNLAQIEENKKQLQHQVLSLELLCQKNEASLKEKEDKLMAQKAELDKIAQINALIHSLSSGKSDVENNK